MISAQVADAFRAHERFVWGLCYRMTGCAADADDLVQETFARALAHPPPRTDAPWRPWLVRVAMNLATDVLRRRKRRKYVGPWLPSPIYTHGFATDGSAIHAFATGDAADGEAPPAHEPVVTGADGRPLTTEGRYDLLESVSFAFLVALEALTAKQRAVLLLRDVFDYAVRDAAEALAMSEANVKVTHLRARRAMAGYDRERIVPGAAVHERTRDALARLMAALAGADVGAVEALLADDVRALSDGGGEFPAARVPVVGRSKVARYVWNVGRRLRDVAEPALRIVNGTPAVVLRLRAGAGAPAGVVFAFDLDAAGRIRRCWSVLATRKLGAVLAR